MESQNECILIYKLFNRVKFNVLIQNRAVKQLIMINHIQNKFYVCVCTVYIYYVYMNTNTWMHIFKKNMKYFILHLFIY